jgi:hypothetical protein
MRVYHGSATAITRPCVITGKYPKDFGEGFYCTALREQAVRWANRYDTPVVSAYDYVSAENLSVCDFAAMTEAWLDFIVACRQGVPHGYDIVSGAMANDQIYNYIADYVAGILTREQFWVLAQFKRPTHQIAFCTPAALACLTFAAAEEAAT